MPKPASSTHARKNRFCSKTIAFVYVLASSIHIYIYMSYEMYLCVNINIYFLNLFKYCKYTYTQ